jgi:DNA invertase Pin-like site-specific DNA recombinase
VNPDHLFLGTPKENMDDRDSKERQARGEKIGLSKLTEDEIRKIRELRKMGQTQQEIADQTGVSQMSISNVLSGKTWKHVE